MQKPDDRQSQRDREWRREPARHCCGWSVVEQSCRVRMEVESVNEHKQWLSERTNFSVKESEKYWNWIQRSPLTSDCFLSQGVIRFIFFGGGGESSLITFWVILLTDKPNIRRLKNNLLGQGQNWHLRYFTKVPQPAYFCDPVFEMWQDWGFVLDHWELLSSRLYELIPFLSHWSLNLTLDATPV